MPTLEILAAAADEAEAAADWYENERPGLGREFPDALNAGLDLLEWGAIAGSPLPGELGEQGVRRVVLRRFPYDIVYLAGGDAVTVLAFAHHSRRPGYWRERINRP